MALFLFVGTEGRALVYVSQKLVTTCHFFSINVVSWLWLCTNASQRSLHPQLDGETLFALADRSRRYEFDCESMAFTGGSCRAGFRRTPIRRFNPRGHDRSEFRKKGVGGLEIQLAPVSACTLRLRSAQWLWRQPHPRQQCAFVLSRDQAQLGIGICGGKTRFSCRRSAQ